MTKIWIVRDYNNDIIGAYTKKETAKLICSMENGDIAEIEIDNIDKNTIFKIGKKSSGYKDYSIVIRQNLFIARVDQLPWCQAHDKNTPQWYPGLNHPGGNVCFNITAKSQKEAIWKSKKRMEVLIKKGQSDLTYREYSTHKQNKTLVQFTGSLDIKQTGKTGGKAI